MDTQEQGTTPEKQTAVEKLVSARSIEISERGIRTGADFANLMSALMSDLISGRVTPEVGNATVSAGGKLLKVVEMQYKYGTKVGDGPQTLVLADAKK